MFPIEARGSANVNVIFQIFAKTVREIGGGLQGVTIDDVEKQIRSNFAVAVSGFYILMRGYIMRTMGSVL